MDPVGAPKSVVDIHIAQFRQILGKRGISLGIFFTRMKPSGVWADLLRARFALACKRARMRKDRFELDCTRFRPPAMGGQLRLL